MFNQIPEALAALKARKMIVLVDHPDRENEGDLVIAAEHITPEKMAFIIRHTGGVVCLALANAIADQLHLPPMVPMNTSRRQTPYTVSIEAAHGVTTGISAADRATTVLAAIAFKSKPNNLHRPGHIFPLRANDMGVIARAGHTEASVDLCRIAGLRAGAVVSELMHDDGTMMRGRALFSFAKKHRLPIVSVDDLIAYRIQREVLVTRAATAELPTAYGNFTIHVYTSALDNKEHVALVMGTVTNQENILTRIHSECLTGDTLSSLRCDCRAQLEAAMKAIAAEGRGIFMYLRQEGRGIGLTNKIKAYALQQKEGLDTVEANVRLGLPADARHYGMSAQILRDLKVKSVRLLTNNPQKLAGLKTIGVTVAKQVALETPPNEHNLKYLKSKKKKLGHLLDNV